MTCVPGQPNVHCRYIVSVSRERELGECQRQPHPDPANSGPSLATCSNAPETCWAKSSATSRRQPQAGLDLAGAAARADRAGPAALGSTTGAADDRDTGAADSS